MRTLSTVCTRLIAALGIIFVMAACAEPAGSGPAASAEPAQPVREVAADRASVSITNAMSGWLHTGLELAEGDSVVLTGTGHWQADGIDFAPRHMLWYRIGEQGAR